MELVINEQELAALSGLPPIQQLAYLLAIRPYMDLKTGIVGVKRRISYQSIAEQLFVEPHQGIKRMNYSRAQLRRALAGLARVGLIEVQSQQLQLILKCPLANQDYFIQNKAVTKPSRELVTINNSKNLIHKGFTNEGCQKAESVNHIKPDTPLNKDNYLFIFLLNAFEQFWELYPQKKDKQKAWLAFKTLNPDAALFTTIMTNLQSQIAFYQAEHAKKQWLPAWKYPANWLSAHAWQDVLTPSSIMENGHEINTTSACSTSFDHHRGAQNIVSPIAQCTETDFERLWRLH